MSRRLVVTADDFGLCPEVNTGVLRAHVDGIVTSASLMVRKPAAADAVAAATPHPGLALGLHVDLGEWVFDDGAWVVVDHVVDADDREAVEIEVERQVGRFVALTGRLPTHLDGHQHVQAQGPAAAVLRALSASLRVPLRMHTGGIAYCGAFYGQDGKGAPYPEGITEAALVEILRSLPVGCTELGCHPGIDVARSVSVYATERSAEVAALCSANVREALAVERIELLSFAQAGHLAAG